MKRTKSPMSPRPQARNRFLKITLLAFFFGQLGFSMFALSLWGTENVFPLYTWNIFHTRPDKFNTRHFLLVSRLDGVEFKPPVDIFDIKDRFPGIDMYTFAQKIHILGQEAGGPAARSVLPLIHESLLRDHKQVSWEFAELTYEVIGYHLNRRVINKKYLGRFESKRPGGGP